MRNRKTQSALLLAGAAAGVAAAWLGRRRLTLVPRGSEARDLVPRRGETRDLVPRDSEARELKPRHGEVPGGEPFFEPESAELPVGRSADPEIDDALSRRLLPQDDTTGATLLGEMGPDSGAGEVGMEEPWSSVPELAEPEQTEGYDAVSPEDLGSIWLERATQTTHEPHASVFESGIPPETEGAVMSEASITSAQALDEVEALERITDEFDPDELDLDEPVPSGPDSTDREPRAGEASRDERDESDATSGDSRNRSS